MKKVYLLIFLYLGLSSPLAFSIDRLLLTTQHWPPYQIYEKNVTQGIAVQVVECVLNKIEQPYSIEVLPWKRAQIVVKQGNYHGFFAASRNNSRDQYADISVPIAEQKWNWYLLKKSVALPDTIQFKKQASVAAMHGSNMREWLEKNQFNVVGRPPTTEALLSMLLKQHVEAILANEKVMERILQIQGISQEKLNIFLNRNKPLGVYFSKQFLLEQPQFLAKFNRFVSGCR